MHSAAVAPSGKPPRALRLILVSALALRLVFLGFDGFHNDVQTFEAWTLTLRDLPFSSFYARAGFADYPPGYLYVLAFLARIYAVIGGGDQGYVLLHALVKLPGIVFDLVDATLMYVLVRRFADVRRGLIAAACVAFHPAFIFISAYWGQVDSVAAALVLVVVIAIDAGLRGLWSPVRVGIIGWTALAISVLIKPPALLLVPLLLAWPVARYLRAGRREALTLLGGTAAGIAVSIAVSYALALPFAPAHGLPAVGEWLIDRYRFGSNVYPYNTINAFNIYAIAQPFWEPDSVHPIGWIAATQGAWSAALVVIAAVAFALRFVALTTPLASLEAAALTLGAFFMLATRMHERYIFDALLLCIAAGAIVVRFRLVAVIVSVTLFINVLYSLRYLDVMTNAVPGVDPRNLMPLLSGPCAVLNALAFAYVALRFVGLMGDGEDDPVVRALASVTRGFPGLRVWFDGDVRLPNNAEGRAPFTRRDALLAASFTVASFVICVVNYSRPGEKIFDEIYYARSGEEYLKHVEQFEWTHPPLTKLIITLSMLLFGGLHGGDNASGWRFLNVVVGALMAGVLYLFAKRLSGSTLVASVAAGFLVLDGFHLVQSRIATPEITVAFFCLLTLYCFYEFWAASAASPEERAPSSLRRRLAIAAVLAGAALCGCALAHVIGSGLNVVLAVWVPSAVLAVYCMAGVYTVLRLFAGRRSAAANRWLLALTLSGGCLAACKWNGLFDFFVVWACALLFALPLDLLIASMLFVGGTMYVVSYLPYFLLGHSFFDLLVLQHSMYAYHTDLRATHPYASAWWQWPILQRPISYYYHDFRTGADAAKSTACCVAEILALPNPLVWWFGLLSVPAVAVLGFIEKRRGYMLLGLAYLFQWLPWIASPRIAFEYHFFPNLAIICCCDALLLQRLWEYRESTSLRSWQRITCVAFCGLVVAAFVFWYPIVAGSDMTYQQWYARVLTWVPFVQWI